MKSLWLATCAFLATPVWAQDASPPAPPASATAAAATTDTGYANDIVITATRRSQVLSDVPIAVSAVSAEQLQNSGGSDIRQLNQLAPSLLVSSATNEASGVARIRGIGTVGENPGLESSVAVFIDGVYRSRTGVGLSELGELDRIEVLRGPQGTLFGRNASAGLINIITKGPSFDFGGAAEATYGNYDYYRLAGSVTGPIVTDKIAARLRRRLRQARRDPAPGCDLGAQDRQPRPLPDPRAVAVQADRRHQPPPDRRLRPPQRGVLRRRRSSRRRATCRATPPATSSRRPTASCRSSARSAASSPSRPTGRSSAGSTRSRRAMTITSGRPTGACRASSAGTSARPRSRRSPPTASTKASNGSDADFENLDILRRTDLQPQVQDLHRGAPPPGHSCSTTASISSSAVTTPTKASS